MLSTIKRLSLLVTACAATVALSACQTPADTTGSAGATDTATDVQPVVNMPTLEHLALGMKLNFPDCPAEVQGENTNITPIDGKVCQFLLEEGQVAEHKVKTYVILLSEGINEGLSGQVNISVDTINDLVTRFSIVTPGLSQQEQIFNLLVSKLGEPADARLVTENVPNSPVDVNGIIATWGVENGRVLFIGGIKGQNTGIINVESLLAIELQQKAMQQAQQQQPQ